MTHLLDANVAIALVTADHEHHALASQWFTDITSVSLCPVVEGALMRFMLRIGESPQTARAILEAFHDHPRVNFITDSISYLDVELADLRRHRQLTDVYLASLANASGLKLATFDSGLFEQRPDQTELLRPISA